MKKVIRLRKWVKILLVLVLVGGVYLIMDAAACTFNSMYENCDNAKGYTCSYYEARQYMIRGE